jgi:site-specific recombinase XerD
MYMAGCKSLTKEEIGKVLGSFNGMNAIRDRALFTLGCFTGFRITELLSLTISDVFQHGAIVDIVHLQRKNTKGKLQGRSQALHPEAKEALKIWITILHGRNDTTSITPLFCSFNHGTKAITSRQAWIIMKNAYAKAGIVGRTGTHCMRKSFAHNIHAELGNDLVKTKQALGHRNFDTTIKYLEVDQSVIHLAVIRMSMK